MFSAATAWAEVHSTREDCLLRVIGTTVTLNAPGGTDPKPLEDKPVTLSGDSQYECDHCGKKTDAKKTERIGHLPDILVVHINRSRWDLRGTRCKLTDHVSFPLKNLDLKYATWDGDAVIADGGRTNYIYNLSAVVSHHGKGLDNGHYTALCLDADSNNWIHFNDRKVTISSEQDVQRTEGYLLFYEKTKSVP
jgi:ubiquitin C-terminal hydrolase